jgi:flagellar FliJ protein
MNQNQNLSKRLDPVRRVAQGREDDAAKRFADSQQLLAQREAQLRDMEKYLAEYEAAKPAPGMGPALLANREAFLRQLGEAIRWQKNAVAEARAKLDAAREHWLRKRCATNVVEHLIERSDNAEQRLRERRLQQELDEFAQRRVGSSPLA